MTCHILKTDSAPFDAIFSGEKTAEFRRDDRPYAVGDILCLVAHDGASIGVAVCTITHCQRGYGIPAGMVMLSLERQTVRRILFAPAV